MPAQAVEVYLNGVGARQVAEREWGLTLEADGEGGWPLDVGIRIADGLVRIQAFALGAARAPDDADVLHWNRRTRMVRFARTRSGDVWVHADLPVELADEKQLDRLMGLVVEAAYAARRRVVGDASR